MTVKTHQSWLKDRKRQANPTLKTRLIKTKCINDNHKSKYAKIVMMKKQRNRGTQFFVDNKKNADFN